MAVKVYRPITSARRYYTSADFSELSKVEPHKPLLKERRKSSGRNNMGRITVRHKGGGVKRKYRIIDFKRNKDSIPAKVATLEYDPNRSSYIALLHYADGEKRYILAPLALKVGDMVESGETVEISPGNNLPISKVPLGTIIHNIELKPGKGAQMARSAGTYAQLLAKEKKYAHLKLPSGEVRLVLQACRATIGQVGNTSHENIKIGKAGRSRWMGIRPTVRGVAMNPVDHPHGGGEGKTSGGRHPVSPTGVPAKGYKTRRRTDSNQYIVRRRKS